MSAPSRGIGVLMERDAEQRALHRAIEGAEQRGAEPALRDSPHYDNARVAWNLSADLSLAVDAR